MKLVRQGLWQESWIVWPSPTNYEYLELESLIIISSCLSAKFMVLLVELWRLKRKVIPGTPVARKKWATFNQPWPIFWDPTPLD